MIHYSVGAKSIEVKGGVMLEELKKLKLSLNNLYGKTASSTDKVPRYLTIGSVISTYAKIKPGFIYADTDGIHCERRDKMLPEFIEERNVHAFEAGRGKYDAPAFLCTLCERPCSLSESYSNRGHHLVCNRCVNAVKKMLHIDTETFLMAFYDELKEG